MGNIVSATVFRNPYACLLYPYVGYSITGYNRLQPWNPGEGCGRCRSSWPPAAILCQKGSAWAACDGRRRRPRPCRGKVESGIAEPWQHTALASPRNGPRRLCIQVYRARDESLVRRGSSTPSFCSHRTRHPLRRLRGCLLAFDPGDRT